MIRTNALVIAFLLGLAAVSGSSSTAAPTAAASSSTAAMMMSNATSTIGASTTTTLSCGSNPKVAFALSAPKDSGLTGCKALAAVKLALFAKYPTLQAAYNEKCDTCSSAYTGSTTPAPMSTGAPTSTSAAAAGNATSTMASASTAASSTATVTSTSTTRTSTTSSNCTNNTGNCTRYRLRVLHGRRRLQATSSTAAPTTAAATQAGATQAAAAPTAQVPVELPFAPTATISLASIGDAVVAASADLSNPNSDLNKAIATNVQSSLNITVAVNATSVAKPTNVVTNPPASTSGASGTAVPVLSSLFVAAALALFR